MRAFIEKYHSWLLPLFLVIFIAQVITLPFALGLAYAESTPDHSMMYMEGNLFWSAGENILPNGAAEMDLFDAEYPNVLSADGRNVVAPGTEGGSSIRLRSFAPGHIDYTAVLYRIRTNENIPVVPTLHAEGGTLTTDYPLPKGVKAEDVICAYSGYVDGGYTRDFTVQWTWDYDVSEEQDAIDTALGCEVPPGEVTVGLYIMVEDNNVYHNPKTGDYNPYLWLHMGLMVFSAAALILLVAEYLVSRKQRELEWELFEESEASSTDC